MKLSKIIKNKFLPPIKKDRYGSYRVSRKRNEYGEMKFIASIKDNSGDEIFAYKHDCYFTNDLDVEDQKFSDTMEEAKTEAWNNYDRFYK